MRKLTQWDVAYAVNMTLACGISYFIITQLLVQFVDAPSDLLGGMWAVAATIFVFRDKRSLSLRAGLDRLLATCISFSLCLIYLIAFPFTPLGMIVLIWVGTLIVMFMNRDDDITTTGITTVVVLVVAALSPIAAWHQPLLRLIDTVVGISVGLSCKWIASYVFFRMVGQPIR
jgi:uncharacterized membrane protein YgaE (UPF0421/DUF939 family)